MRNCKQFAILVLCTLGLLSACGGGGSGTSSPGTTTAGTTEQNATASTVSTVVLVVGQ